MHAGFFKAIVARKVEPELNKKLAGYRRVIATLTEATS